MKSFWLICFVFFLLGTINAQSIKNEYLRARINEYFKKQSNSSYFFTVRQKLEGKTDTFIGRYQLNVENNIDSENQFSIYINDSLSAIYSNNVFYTLNKRTKKIRQEFVAENMLSKVVNFKAGLLLFPEIAVGSEFLDSVYFSEFMISKNEKNYVATLAKQDISQIGKDTSSLFIQKTKIELTFDFNGIFKEKKEWIGNQFTYITLDSIKPNAFVQVMFEKEKFEKNGWKLEEKETTKPKFYNFEGDTMPFFSLKNQFGEVYTFPKDSKGIVVFDFWFKNCLPCLKSMPILERFSKKMANQNVEVIGINGIDKNIDEINAVLAKKGIRYSCLIDEKKQLTSMIGVSVYPTILVVDSQKRVIILSTYGLQDEDLEQTLLKAIENYKSK